MSKGACVQHRENIIFEGGCFKSKAASSGSKDFKRVREWERAIGTRIELLFTSVGATNFGQPYRLGIYTPKLGPMHFWLITNMARPLMDSVNKAIRCMYSTRSRSHAYIKGICM
jgi:hypothetical protein